MGLYLPVSLQCSWAYTACFDRNMPLCVAVNNCIVANNMQLFIAVNEMEVINHTCQNVLLLNVV